MNVITAYLETMFSTYPQTPRLLEAKAELQTMMEDAYAGYLSQGASENEAVGRVITEFGNLDEVAPALGISQEIHPPAANQLPAPSQPSAPAPAPLTYAPITMEEAEGYANARRKTEPRLALGVALCVISPALLVSLAPLGASGMFGFDERAGALIGLLALLILVTSGVLIFVRRSQQLAQFDRITSSKFTRSLSVERWAKSLEAEHSGRRTVRLQVAIVLWILSAAPVLTIALLPTFTDAASDSWSGVGAACTLIMVAAGLLIFLPSNWAADTAEALTRSGRPDPATGAPDEDERSLVGTVASIYWPLLTVIFLAWSFIGDAWDRSWIVWPIGAVLFGAIAGALNAIESSRKSRRTR
ncbi:permease prefix domain 1-containing protein [Leucobacter denitrificans]|uniref:Uncharacterized protein n=1 Tax=Leucobacter denitrificans TaxID=683042 RepID=A0A7G9S4R9_9MICO|nr:permease prefix domain 1-containing protein [Leucobacter denitrificans]QNN62844.1 hypothetical protein H9L06_00085 [Leucobacter denitrificans]